MRFKLKTSIALLVALVVGGATSYSVDLTAQETDLTQRLEQLEKKTELLEQLLFSSVKLETKRAQRALEERQDLLKHSKQLFAKGFLAESQLLQDQYRVEEAQRELEIATDPDNHHQPACELNVIDAKRKLQIAKDELAHQSLLASKGYVSQTRVSALTRSVDEATLAFEYANTKLKAAKELDAINAVAKKSATPEKSDTPNLQDAAQEAEAMFPKPGPEMDIFKGEVGTWNAEIKMWAGPGEPEITEGSETNRMLGGFWLLSDFEGKMMGMDFQGHGIYGYDPEKKQYIGIWMDSLSPAKMDMTGKYDKATKTLSMEGVAPGPDGKPTKHVITTKTNDDGSRLMTMFVGGDKLFEMKYTKKAAGKK